MSQAKKHVEWCLQKAEKEMKEEGDHKGLIKGNPDEKLAYEHIEKSEHNLKALIHNRKNFSDWSIKRLSKISLSPQHTSWHKSCGVLNPI